MRPGAPFSWYIEYYDGDGKLPARFPLLRPVPPTQYDSLFPRWNATLLSTFGRVPSP